MDLIYSGPVYESIARTLVNFGMVTLVITALTILFSYLLFKNESRKERRLFYVSVLSVVVLGGLTGFSGGLSRTGVVGDLIPAVLTFLAGLVAYLFGLKDNRNLKVPVYVISFAIAIFINYSLGSNIRNNFEKTVYYKERCVELFSAPKILSNNQALENAKKLFSRKCKKHVDNIYTGVNTP